MLGGWGVLGGVLVLVFEGWSWEEELGGGAGRGRGRDEGWEMWVLILRRDWSA